MIAKQAKTQGRATVSIDQAFAALREIQGGLGGIVSENTPSLNELHFDPEQRKKLQTLAQRMENIDEVERMGGEVPKGCIFHGPPGTGKTIVAKSLSKASGWAFLSTTGSDLMQDGGKSVDKLLAKARDLRPCIVFIDEAENALGDRTTNRYGGDITTKILAATDGVSALHDVLFIAATNHPNQLDSAITRGGRFSEHFEFKKPEEDTVLKMVSEWINGKKHNTPFHPEFTAEKVTPLLHGLAPADIKDRLQQAVNTGVGRILANDGEPFVMLADLKV